MESRKRSIRDVVPANNPESLDLGLLALESRIKLGFIRIVVVCFILFFYLL